MKPIIIGLAGLDLNAEEEAAIRAAEPAGFILFGRNVASRVQLRRLTDRLRVVTGRETLPILIDQEGGRVARLGPPDWPSFPAAARFAALYARAPMTAIEAARLNAEVIGMTLWELGITVTCAPVLDLTSSETHEAIGDRSFGTDPIQVAALGRASLTGLAAGGVAGVIKHMPGQGRARTDSHVSLPVVRASATELERDLTPFKALADAGLGMTGHIIYEAWDSAHPATLSKVIIRDIIRGEIGFDGLLLSDDLHMDALTGSLPDRAVKAVEAGCDLALACHVAPAELSTLAAALPDITDQTHDRLNHAVRHLSPGKDVDKIAALIDNRDALLAYAV
jgi:beta-N-acetylhexosaminidase